MSGWPSGLRRQTQGIDPSLNESSGPRMRAWVRIPLLTKTFFNSFANHTFLENDYLDIIPNSQKYTPILPLCKLLLEFIGQKSFTIMAQ